MRFPALTSGSVCLLCLLWLLWLLALPAAAAPPVAVDPTARPPQVAAYVAAARARGLTEWTAPAAAGGPVRIYFRPGAQTSRLTIELPPKTSPSAAVTWLGSLSDQMGWRSPDLLVTPRPEALYLRAEYADPGRGPGLAHLRTRLALNLDLLAARLAELSDQPAVLAVRTVGADLLKVEPEPAARGRLGMSDYLFYRLGAGAGATRGTLRLDLGLPDRWIAAAVLTVLLWVVSPFVVLYQTREGLRKRGAGDAKQKLQAYRRWQRGVLFGTLFGSQATFFLLGFSRLIFLLASGGVFLFVGGIFFPLAAIPIGARVIGLPLEREAWPHRKDLPWYRMAAGELFLTAMMLVIPLAGLASVLPGLLSASSRRMGTSVAFPFFVTLPFLFLGLAAAVTAFIGWLRWRRRERGVSGEPDASEAVRTAVCELTAGLDCPIERVLIIKGGGAAQLAVRGRMAVVTRELSEELEPDQVAGLVAAAALALPRTRSEKFWMASRWGLLLLPLVMVGGLFWSLQAGGGGRPSGATGLFMLVPALIVFPAMFLARRDQKRQEDRDLRVADAIGPRRFLDALRKLEEFQIAAVAVDANTAQRSAVYTVRRTRLERRLGLE